MRILTSPPRLNGFTLIELMITVVIASVLAAVAYPSFMNMVYKSRRADASAALTRVQQALERYRSSHTSYTTDNGPSGLNVPLTSPDGHYSLAVTLPAAGSGTTYQITATAQGKQANDTKCRLLMIEMIGQGTLRYSSSDGSTTVSSAANPCWNR